MTPTQRTLARAALGLPNAMRRSYRNYYRISPGNTGYEPWDEMVDQGEAFAGRDWTYHLTRHGAKAALDPGEKLDPEDFPEPARGEKGAA